jgi:hypothetical protein
VEIVGYVELNWELGVYEVVTEVELLFFDYSGPYFGNASPKTPRALTRAPWSITAKR